MNWLLVYGPDSVRSRYGPVAGSLECDVKLHYRSPID